MNTREDRANSALSHSQRGDSLAITKPQTPQSQNSQLNKNNMNTNNNNNNNIPIITSPLPTRRSILGSADNAVRESTELPQLDENNPAYSPSSPHTRITDSITQRLQHNHRNTLLQDSPGTTSSSSSSAQKASAVRAEIPACV